MYQSIPPCPCLVVGQIQLLLLLLHYSLSRAFLRFSPWSFPILFFVRSLFSSIHSHVRFSGHILLELDRERWLSCARVRCILSYQFCASPFPRCRAYFFDCFNCFCVLRAILFYTKIAGKKRVSKHVTKIVNFYRSIE